MTSEPPTGQRYDATTIILHWLVVALVGVLWGGARLLEAMPAGSQRADARSLHIMLGVALGLIGGARFVWRLSWGRPLPPSDTGWRGASARATHQGLYLLLAIMVVLGILLAWTGGDTLFNQFRLEAPDAETRALARRLLRAHAAVGWSIVALAGLHSLAVLFHQLVLHDRVLSRMAPWASRGRG